MKRIEISSNNLTFDKSESLTDSPKLNMIVTNNNVITQKVDFEINKPAGSTKSITKIYITTKSVSQQMSPSPVLSTR